MTVKALGPLVTPIRHYNTKYSFVVDYLALDLFLWTVELINFDSINI